MKIRSLLLATLVTFALVAPTGFAEDQPAKCCAKAKEAGKDCTHGECCVEAKKNNTVCEKCGGKKDDKKKPS
jgi:hypothetical protein